MILDAVFDTIGDNMLSGHKGETERYIKELVRRQNNINVLLAALTASLPWRTELKHVRELLVEEVYKIEPVRSEILLRGLI